MTPRVSIVIPTYNHADYLPQALASVRRQTLPDWEAIVVDDGSTDRTSDVLKSWNDARVRYIYQENRGPSAARNRGLALARGEFVTMLDADDWLTPDSLADRVAFLDEHSSYGAVYSDGYVCDAAGRVLRRLSRGRSRTGVGDIYSELVQDNFLGTLSPVVVRTGILRKHDICFDESSIFVEDWDFLMRLAQHVRFGYVQAPCVWYRLHGRNRTPLMCDRRSLDSHARAFTKVVRSERFTRVSAAVQLHVYKRLVPVYLDGYWNQQVAIIQDAPFQGLPRRYQAEVLRLLAGEYLARGERWDDSHALLSKACSLWPADLKARLLAFGMELNPSITAKLLCHWRRRFSPRQNCARTARYPEAVAGRA